ncbi:BrnT family toxin [Rhizobium sp. C4]|uniref:BrnT family toxin n=1 Tax=Rhizobium sp. C4 TaxID=1349800 RepID=UPI001E634E1C|nr:BrnT family toxin [Rhizobium sp. C4]MCD2174767.1 BrnT family toxin [Rhizobium sp. C4]
MKIVWDENKRRANLAKHGLDFADLTLEFFALADVERAKLGRFVAVGDFRGRLVVAVIFRPLGVEAISIISMRPASERERRR